MPKGTNQVLSEKGRAECQAGAAAAAGLQRRFCCTTTMLHFLVGNMPVLLLDVILTWNAHGISAPASCAALQTV